MKKIIVYLFILCSLFAFNGCKCNKEEANTVVIDYLKFEEVSTYTVSYGCGALAKGISVFKVTTTVSSQQIESDKFSFTNPNSTELDISSISFSGNLSEKIENPINYTIESDDIVYITIEYNFGTLGGNHKLTYSSSEIANISRDCNS
jgi:hypothetical protein